MSGYFQALNSFKCMELACWVLQDSLGLCVSKNDDEELCCLKWFGFIKKIGLQYPVHLWGNILKNTYEIVANLLICWIVNVILKYYWLQQGQWNACQGYHHEIDFRSYSEILICLSSSTTKCTECSTCLKFSNYIVKLKYLKIVIGS